jgi:3',5'-cyclic AMP phosphodiesterase CpdA
VAITAVVVVLLIGSPELFSPSDSSPSPDRRTPVSTEPPEPIKDEPLARIAIAGDTGTRGAAEEATAKRMQIEAEREGKPYDALVITGDLVYPNGDADLTEESVTEPFAETLDDAELIPVLGNHDVDSGDGREIMSRLGRDTKYYADTIGPVRFLALDSNRVSDPQQMSWLRRELEKKQDPGTWTIPVMHHPAYSAGDHGSTPSVQRRWLPLFEEAGIRLTLAGHDHDYQRSIPIAGITHIVTGGGAKLRPTGRQDFTEVSESVHHYVDLLVYKDRLEGRAIDHDGFVIDEFTIRH